ncbi:hypothetical protein CVT25_001290 [Psilocybe cyanescens]|uniref:Uncharacterized protein n=1 Tax=Psilocybe cyanescens TaxID=93625 RepID=A0A409XMA3_PSICY|nr:hypothetical protein CVT25_001290 [Psilocybe cyanescens]
MPSWWSSFLDFFRGDPSHKQFNQAKKLYAKFEASNGQDLKALNESLATFELALNNRRKTKDGVPHSDLDITLTTYASALWKRYEAKKSPSDLHKVIELDEEAYILWENTDPASRPSDYANLLFDLGNAYYSQYEANHKLSGMLEKAIEKYEKLTNETDIENRRKGLVKLGIALRTWCDDEDISQTKTAEQKATRLDSAITYLLEAVDHDDGRETTESLTRSDTTQQQALLNLAMAYYLRFQDCRRRVDLDSAIESNRKALKIITEGSGDYVYCLFDLAQQLFAKYEYEQGRRSTGEHRLGEWLDVELKANKGAKELKEAEGSLEKALKTLGVGSDVTLKTDMQKLLATVQEHIQSLSRSPSRNASSQNLAQANPVATAPLQGASPT